MNFLKYFFAIVLLSWPITMLAAESTITGTVTNKTTNRPAAGDDVILLELKQGMQEIARTKTDAKGGFTLHFAESPDPHLLRVNHRNVNYHHPVRPGSSTVNVEVYDAAESLSQVSQSLDVMRLEADSGTLSVIEMFGITNASSPPKTLMATKSFQFVLPEGAQIKQSLAAGPGGMPVQSAPIPAGEKNHYSILFPIRPGESRFQISYTMPYNGSAEIDPQLLRPTDNFAVSISKSMQLSLHPGSKLEARGEDAGMAVYVAQNVAIGTPLGFTISGTGSVPLDKTTSQSNADNQAPLSTTNRPGGGMAVPINTPDPLYKYRWWLIAGVSLALVAGAAYSMRGTQKTTIISVAATSMSGVLKEELFRLESDRLENRISGDEYAKTKAALDVLMVRSLSRND